MGLYARNKSDALNAFKMIQTYVTTQFNTKIKTIQYEYVVNSGPSLSFLVIKESSTDRHVLTHLIKMVLWKGNINK